MGCGGVTGLVVLVVLGILLWGLFQLRGSLPRLDGNVPAPGLGEAVIIERDALGIPTVRASDRRQAAYGLGYAHAQDRFFQMDLLRRQSSGELAALFGSALQGWDQRVRFHSFRRHARRVEGSLPAETRSLLAAYADGVNAGFESLRKPPFEYLVAGGEPEPWAAEDSILVLLAMFFFLGDDDGEYDRFLDDLNAGLPPALYEFLTPAGTPWDAPMIGEAAPSAPLPGPQVCNLEGASPVPPPEGGGPEDPTGGASNAWALAGGRTASGGALVAADLHVELTVPILWYRASLAWPVGGREQRVTGITVPGAPLVVVGSNGRVAWAFTNSRADTTDVVRLESVPGESGSYRTAEGPEPFELVQETIEVREGEDLTLDTRWTRWGPVVEEDGELFALRWTAHETEAVNLNLLKMETAAGLEEALEISRDSGLPALNFFVATADGRIGWTMAGQLPHRAEGAGGRLPIPWQEADSSWNRWLVGDEVPTVADPPGGLLWNANNRTVGGPSLGPLGDGNYVLGARAKQIRGFLEETAEATEADMLRLQLDDRALFLERWQGLLLETLEGTSCDAFPRRCEALEVIRDWGARASVGSAGYPLVRGFRHAVGERVFDGLLRGCGFAGEEEVPPYYDEFGQAEGPLWTLVSERPEHLLPPAYDTWDELLLSALDAAAATAEDEEEVPLAERTWGRQNRLAMKHLFSSAVPAVGRWLDMPADPLAGDSYMPKLQLSRYGASQRMAVSPGREQEGYFHMPGGQSGHPLSRHYRDGHQAWLEGEPTPFLPGETVHTLTLLPQKEGRHGSTGED